jgi:steroid delta-isomerase-like uncharacterized protein
VKTYSAHLVALATFIFVGAACQQQPVTEQAETTEPVDTTAELEAAANTFIEMWNTKNYDLLDTAMAVDFKRQAPDQSAEGLEEMKEFVSQVHAAYPDFHIVVDESAYGENLAFTHWTVTGTHSGEGSVPATGKSVEISGITMLRFRDGMITDEIVYYDTASLQAQLETEGIPHAE